ncbi:MAG: hypothetical protein IPN42_18135 [Methylococcaceae bacterium]|nr:hypothetical protein [Methylococcaceae bacterium]
MKQLPSFKSVLLFVSVTWLITISAWANAQAKPRALVRQAIQRMEAASGAGLKVPNPP